MRQEKPTKNWILFVCVLLLAPALAGCFGDDAPTNEDDGNDARVSTGGEPKGPDRRDDMSGALNDPSAHYHHYWEDRTEVIIYHGSVPFNNWNTRYLEPGGTLSWAEFSTLDDGDEGQGNDVTGQQPDPGPVVGGIADTVFAGTTHIDVHFPEAEHWPPGVRMMFFQWKPANTPIFSDLVPVHPGEVFKIRLTEVGESDPPHQFLNSRWMWRLYATNEQCETFNLNSEQCPPAVILDPDGFDPEQGGGTYYWGSRSGDDGLLMIAHTDGEKHLDPPHPNFWVDGDVRDLGRHEDTVETTIQTPLVRERVNALNDISMPPNNIVPLGTEKVEVRVTWENTAPFPGSEDVYLQLYYHGADHVEYRSAGEARQDGKWWVYEIYDEDEDKVDPPYESNSFWRFKLVPTLKNDGGLEQENLAIFEGDFQMEFSAHKKPGYVLE